jgi:uncharacterized protein (TIGR02996 family)
MNEEAAFLEAMLEDPNDLALRIVFADWLEERGDPRGELLHLTHILTQSIDVPQRPEKEARLQALVDEGVPALGPIYTNGIDMRFAWIPPGTFLMGSTETGRHRRDCFVNETQHRVILTKGFFMGIHHVTQGQYQTVMGKNPSYFKGDSLPVECVSWNDSIIFCKKLSKQEGTEYQLPGEAQWEYACRAGTASAFCFGNDPSKLDEYAWYGLNSSSQPQAVGQKKPNAWGLYDMHGNVRQWCWDWFGDYPVEQVADPQGASHGDARVLRGGSWDSDYDFCRAAFRYGYGPGDRVVDTGLRVCFRPE